VCAVLRHALDALQWTVSEAGSELLQLLRCLRRVWVLLVEDAQLQVRAAHQVYVNSAGSECRKVITCMRLIMSWEPLGAASIWVCISYARPFNPSACSRWQAG
jgi:hypothetical protein